MKICLTEICLALRKKSMSGPSGTQWFMVLVDTMCDTVLLTPSTGWSGTSRMRSDREGSPIPRLEMRWPPRAERSWRATARSDSDSASHTHTRRVAEAKGRSATDADHHPQRPRRDQGRVGKGVIKGRASVCGSPSSCLPSGPFTLASACVRDGEGAVVLGRVGACSNRVVARPVRRPDRWRGTQWLMVLVEHHV